MQLYVGHVTSDAIALAPLVCMRALTVVAGMARLVIKGRIVSLGILMCGMARRAVEVANPKTAALHEPKWLEANILDLIIPDRRLKTMAISAKAHLFRG